jgi:hypothetical protein
MDSTNRTGTNAGPFAANDNRSYLRESCSDMETFRRSGTQLSPVRRSTQSHSTSRCGKWNRCSSISPSCPPRRSSRQACRLSPRQGGVDDSCDAAHGGQRPHIYLISGHPRIFPDEQTEAGSGAIPARGRQESAVSLAATEQEEVAFRQNWIRGGAAECSIRTRSLRTRELQPR